MTNTLSIAIAQVNLIVGDIDGNAGRVIDIARRAAEERNCGVVVFPELTLTGYPPEDLLLRPAFLQRAEAALNRVTAAVTDVGVILGHPLRADGALYNAASFIYRGKVLGVYRKQHLPNYSVFDEKRYFAPGNRPCVVEFDGTRVGLTVCEDICDAGPVEDAAAAGARLIVNINASPFHIDRARDRLDVVAARAKKVAMPIVYANLVGGQDELVFDGASFVVDANGGLTQRGAHFKEELIKVDMDLDTLPHTPLPGTVTPLDDVACSVYQALVLGTRDYILKNGFQGAVIGLSGGVDSALTLAVAVDALGPEHVEAVHMPSRYTASMSVEDARLQAEALGVTCHMIPIEPMFNAFLDGLKEIFTGRDPDETEENLQARCRGVLLMAMSNKFGKLVLTTGNKSEMSVGYATLYGDMAGGFAVIKDVSKTLVFKLARYRNSLNPVIPERVLARPPSAELRADQRDEDSLPAYDVLDPILERYIECDQSQDEIIQAGYPAQVVQRVVAMVNRNEYKRRQAPPGVRITRRAFGRDRRYPITSGYKR